jgi:glutathione S-transferase
VTLRLSHAPNSRSARVRWLLEELGADYELRLVRGEDRSSAEHRQRHPLGRVPALETDEGTLFETAAICLHLAEQHPESGLLPAEGSFARALVYQWISVGLTEIEPFLAEAARAAESDPPRAETARGRVRGTVEVLDAALTGHEYLVGERMSVADVLCGSALFAARRAGLTAEAPALDAYLARLEARPARKRAYEPTG